MTNVTQKGTKGLITAQIRLPYGNDAIVSFIGGLFFTFVSIIATFVSCSSGIYKKRKWSSIVDTIVPQILVSLCSWGSERPQTSTVRLLNTQAWRISNSSNNTNGLIKSSAVTPCGLQVSGFKDVLYMEGGVFLYVTFACAEDTQLTVMLWMKT